MLFEISKGLLFLFILALTYSYLGYLVFVKFLQNLMLDDNWLLIFFISSMLGVTISISILFFLGVIRYLTPLSILVIHLISLITLQIMNGVGFKEHFKCNLECIFEMIIIIAFLLNIAFVSYKPIGIWDDTMFHLPQIRYYLENGGFLVNQYLRFPLMPQNVNLLQLVGYTFLQEFGAQILSTYPVFLVQVGFLGLSKKVYGNIFVGVVASLALLLVSPIAQYIGYAYIDLGLALFSFSTILCIFLVFDKYESNSTLNVNSLLIMSGSFAGLAVGSKYFGAVFAAIVSFLIVFDRKLRAKILYFIIPLILFGSWWYIRSFLISGDPFSPAGGNIFGYYIWNESDLLSQVAEQGTHGVSPMTFDFFGSLQIAGAGYVSLSLIGLIRIVHDKRYRFIYLTSILYFMFWFFVTQVDRYLLIAIPFLIYLSVDSFAYLILKLESILQKEIFSKGITKIILYIMSFTLVANLLITSTKTMISIDGDWDKIIESRPGYELFNQANKYFDGKYLLQIGFENAIYFYKGIAIGDWFGPGRYSGFINSEIEHSIDVDKVTRFLEEIDSTLVIVSKIRYPLLSRSVFDEKYDVLFENEQGLLLKMKGVK